MSRRLQMIAVAIGLVLIAVLIVPFFIPVDPLPGLESEISLAGPDSRYLTVPFAGTGGIALHYVDAGGGPLPVILLHAEDSDLYEWSSVITGLAPHTRAVAYDRLPFGLSEHILPGHWMAENPYSMQSAEVMLFLAMDELKIPRAVLVASSGSVQLAIQAALDQPDRVAGLVLVAPEAYGSSWSLLGALGAAPQVNRLGPLLMRRMATAQPDAIRRLAADPSGIDPATLGRLSLTYRVQNWDIAMWEYTKAAAPLDLSGRLRELRTPALILAGDHDPAVPLSAQQQLAGAIPDARLEIVRGSGHLPQLEHPGEVSKVIELFVAGLGK